jgi:radical SAM superfamily enzyme YgiQ (UPF0313 family)
MKLLLISPKFDESFWSVRWIVTQLTPERPETLPPLGLATLAALCPPHWEVEIVNENLDPVPLDPTADIIGISGMGVQFERQKELLNFYRSRGHYVVVGGSYASLCPELYEPFADSIVSGESEYVWADFCRDFEAGVPKKLYKETREVSLQDSPTPRFDLAQVGRYHMGSVQFTRGCPFTCEFCDIIVMFGRKPRFKTLQQVEKELDLLYDCGAHDIFITDDNFIGNKKIAREMLHFLVDYQKKRKNRFTFGTEVSLNVAQDEDLLRLFREAQFHWFLIGVESPNEASLAETKKNQNLREDILTALNRVQSRGFNIWSSMIVGFDHDSERIFDQHFDFIQKAGLQRVPISLLTAFPKTPLHARLESEGRLTQRYDNDMLRFGTNIVPKQMDYDVMVEQYRNLHRRLFSDRHIADRVKTRSKILTAPSTSASYSRVDQVKIVSRLLYRGILKGGPGRCYHFLRSLPYRRPMLIADALLDWSVALQIRDFTRRTHVRASEFDKERTHRVRAEMEKAFARHVRHGALEMATETDSLTGSLTITVRGALGGSAFGFYSRVRRYLRTILEVTLASIIFKVEAIPESEVNHLNRLLKHFPLHCDRFYVDIKDSLKNSVRVDAVKVNIVLHPREPGISRAGSLTLDGDPGAEGVTTPLRRWHKEVPATRVEAAR